ncbi:pyridoxamine 5'-phosphate oxidase family protein [Kitasatospora sp. RG8]|uniref:pyridoxamine 5'-phosphate oxidase family protein n=1 Tax=Kitasatospora sp. RG8 TaxID=2820815 RepID=UPI001ADF2953|nr:pyridoxamine 5'-phosphate oxidase family protein [Kitasatospora sp. RG8]MBP0450042.1 pyridoxamine 5'-phosphate oxidase family protein [Kitasatospora sp. RG8]
MPYRLDVTQGDWPAEELRKGVEGLLGEAMVLTLATAGHERGPHANLAFYAFDDDLVLYFVSERATRHSHHLAEEARAAATVFLPPPVFGEQLRGIQLTGSAGEAWGHQAQAAFAAYQGRYPAFGQDEEVRRQFLTGGGAAALYRFQVEELTAVDEPHFGRRNYLRAAVVR